MPAQNFLPGVTEYSVALPIGRQENTQIGVTRGADEDSSMETNGIQAEYFERDTPVTVTAANGVCVWAVGSGLMTGTDEGRIDPQGNAIRAETATILQRFLES